MAKLIRKILRRFGYVPLKPPKPRLRVLITHASFSCPILDCELRTIRRLNMIGEPTHLDLFQPGRITIRVYRDGDERLF